MIIDPEAPHPAEAIEDLANRAGLPHPARTLEAAHAIRQAAEWLAQDLRDPHSLHTPQQAASVAHTLEVAQAQLSTAVACLPAWLQRQVLAGHAQADVPPAGTLMSVDELRAALNTARRVGPAFDSVADVGRALPAVLAQHGLPVTATVIRADEVDPEPDLVDVCVTFQHDGVEHHLIHDVTYCGWVVQRPTPGRGDQIDSWDLGALGVLHPEQVVQAALDLIRRGKPQPVRVLNDDEDRDEADGGGFGWREEPRADEAAADKLVATWAPHTPAATDTLIMLALADGGDPEARLDAVARAAGEAAQLAGVLRANADPEYGREALAALRAQVAALAALLAGPDQHLTGHTTPERGKGNA